MFWTGGYITLPLFWISELLGHLVRDSLAKLFYSSVCQNTELGLENDAIDAKSTAIHALQILRKMGCSLRGQAAHVMMKR